MQFRLVNTFVFDGSGGLPLTVGKEAVRGYKLQRRSSEVKC